MEKIRWSLAGFFGFGVVQPQVAVDQDGHQVGGGHRRRRVARAGGGRRADGVHPQLLAELAPEVGVVGHHAATSLSLVSRPSIRSAKDLANFSTPSRSSICDDVVVGDAGGLERVEDPARLLGVLEQRVAADLAVVLDGLDRARAASC